MAHIQEKVKEKKILRFLPIRPNRLTIHSQRNIMYLGNLFGSNFSVLFLKLHEGITETCHSLLENRILHVQIMLSHIDLCVTYQRTAQIDFTGSEFAVYCH